MLELKNITKTYLTGGDSHPALNGINISFRENEFVSILGPSGCGKTTLLNIIGGLDSYTDGDLIIRGKSTKNFTDNDFDVYRNKSIGFVFQSYNLISHQTVLSNVELALTLSGVSKSERRRRAIEALESVGLGDQLKKKPNQMSGGQMQRVAIARALVNDPDILLADEPTGALDSETSVQIMEILRKIAEKKLVIMVTHNPELADKYSTRIIRVLDGRVIDDSAPYNGEEKSSDAPVSLRGAKKKRDKTKSMSFLTALSLSLNNLMTKKTRTFMTSFAGSIGIIGIALILSVSSGVNNYIAEVQENTLSSYPLTINAETNDMMSIMTSFMDRQEEKSHVEHEENRVYSNDVLYDMMGTMTQTEKNNLRALKEHIDSSSEFKDVASAIRYSYDIGFNMYTKDPTGRIIQSDMNALMSQMTSDMGMGNYGGSQMLTMGGMNIWTEMLPGSDGSLISTAVTDQYDLLYGSWPEEYDQVILVVNNRRELSDYVLYSLGLKPYDEMLKIVSASLSGEEVKPESTSDWSFDEICSKEYRLVLSSDKYARQADGTYADISLSPDGLAYLYGSSDTSVPIKISGIVALKEDSSSRMIGGIIGYTSALSDYIIEESGRKDLVREQLESKETDIITGKRFRPDVLPEYTDTEKSERIRGYFDSLDEHEKAEIYLKIMCTPTDEYIDSVIDGQLATIDREELENSIATSYASNSGVSDIDSILEYFHGMNDEEFAEFFRQNARNGIIKSYSDEMMASGHFSEMSDEQIILTFEAAERTEADYAALHDRYMPDEYSSSTYEDNLKMLGYVDVESPTAINIYVSTFSDKDKVSELIDKYNEGQSDENKIKYTDYFALMMSSISTVINAISYVLVAFVSISLVVSSIMIGIITYISVLERTKEIGILRAIGASKRDISRVFNAETLIVGFVAGVIGIGVSLLLTVPINMVLYHFTQISSLKATLPWVGSIILVCISMLLTFIAGLIPSGIAARKNPVEALRTE